MGRVKSRFELLIFETAAEYQERMRKEEADREIKRQIYKKKIEKRGICDGCKKPKSYLRWVRNDEFYVCYECFIEDLSCEADVMVPMRNVTQMDGYVEKGIWSELWKEENGLEK